jgi:hypothetical protein
VIYEELMSSIPGVKNKSVGLGVTQGYIESLLRVPNSLLGYMTVCGEVGPDSLHSEVQQGMKVSTTPITPITAFRWALVPRGYFSPSSCRNGLSTQCS